MTPPPPTIIETLQNAVVVVGFFGLLVGLFGMKIKHQPGTSAQRKSVSKQNPKRTVSKKETVQPRKSKTKKGQNLSKTNKPREWAKMPPITPEYIANVERMLKHR